MLDELKGAWDKLSDEERQNVRDNLEDPEFFDRAMKEFFLDATADIRAVAGDVWGAIRKGFDWSRQRENIQRRGENMQYDVQNRQAERYRTMEDAGMSRRIWEAVQMRLGQTLAGGEVDESRVEGMNGLIDKWGSEHAVELQATLDAIVAEHGEQQFPDTLEELLNDPVLSSQVAERMAWLSVRYPEQQPRMAAQMDALLANYQSETASPEGVPEDDLPDDENILRTKENTNGNTD